LSVSRFGFAIGKKLGGAVQRNKAKRRLREILRASPAGPGWDVVVIARAGAMTASFDELRVATLELLQRAKLNEAPVGLPSAGGGQRRRDGRNRPPSVLAQRPGGE